MEETDNILSEKGGKEEHGDIINESGNVYREDSFLFDFDKQIYFKGDEQVNMCPNEKKLLKVLIDNRGRYVSKEDIAGAIWGDDIPDAAVQIIRTLIGVLCIKLEDREDSLIYIQPGYKLGYMWKKTRNYSFCSANIGM